MARHHYNIPCKTCKQKLLILMAMYDKALLGTCANRYCKERGKSIDLVKLKDEGYRSKGVKE